ncbi:MAG: cobalamin-dependent protein [Gemmatimonadales bacterium]|nr:MAG: cobalamin-dependent protein [Gemmatimonadales bacterium]
MPSTVVPTDPELAALLPVPREAAQRFESARSDLVARVDAGLFRRPDLGVLLGDATSSSVRELHRYLAAFFSSVYELGVPEMLRDGLPRLLAGYRSRGLSDDYFEVLPELWCQALQDQLGARSQPLRRVWDWMRDHPDAWVPQPDGPGAHPELSEVAVRLLDALLTGDAPGARSVIQQALQEGAGVDEVFVEVIQPALYEIGHRWEHGRISAAQEHLASGLVARILATLDDGGPAREGRLAVVTTAPTETHEFGAWMVADVLRNAGWSVRFLGSQLPVAEILHYLRQVGPALLCVSVTLEIHLPSLRHLVAALRDDPELAETRVLVGGQAFGPGERVWKTTGADALAGDARQVVTAAERLVAERGADPPRH